MKALLMFILINETHYYMTKDDVVIYSERPKVTSRVKEARISAPTEEELFEMAHSYFDASSRCEVRFQDSLLQKRYEDWCSNFASTAKIF